MVFIVSFELDIYDTLIINEIELTTYPFYDICPIVSYGKDRESLTSFMLRLANVHCVTLGKLTANMFTPNLKERYSKNPYRFPPPHLNGFGKLTDLTLDALENLSGLRNTSTLTLKGFEFVFSMKSLLKNKRAWCPSCLQDMKDECSIIYEKLIWNITKYDVCIRHQTRLLDTCYNCGKNQETIPNNGQNGHCQHCNSWLGRKSKNKIEENILYKAIDEVTYFKSKQIEEILDYYSNKQIDLSNLTRAFKKIDEASRFEIQRQDLCVFNLGIPYVTFNNYCNGTGRVALENLLEISWKLNVSALKLLENRPFDYTLNKSDYIPRKRKYNHSSDSERVERFLKEMLDSSEYIPITIFEDQLNISTTTLRKRFPDLVQKIIMKNNLLRKENGKKSVEKAFSYDYTRISEYISEKLHSSELTPINNIASSLGVSSQFLTKRFKNLTNEIMKKNENLMKQRAKKEKQSSTQYKKFEKDDYKEIEDKLLGILHLISDEPIYIKDILKKLGKSQHFTKFFPEIFNLIKEANIVAAKRKRDGLYQERCKLLKETIINLLENDIYPGVKQIEKHIDFSICPGFIEPRSMIFEELGIVKRNFGF